MSYFGCKKIEYIFTENATIDHSGKLVPKTNYDYTPLFTVEQGNFTEESAKDGQDTFYNQNLSVGLKYDTPRFIQQFHDKDFIIRLTKTDNTNFIWGHIDPYNPVKLEINTEKGIAELKFSRKSTLPEI